MFGKRKEFSRAEKAKMNIIMSLGSQIVVLICGLIIPRLMIANYGSVAYGATTSIAQFLGYISLLEGGICGVARAALYKPIAEEDSQSVSNILGQLKRFFRLIASIFIVYVIFLAFFFKDISHAEEFDRSFTFWLVIVISISTFAQYFIGITYSVFIQAAQKSYITNLMSIITVALNTIATIVLVNMGLGLIVVKLVSSLIFVIRPFVFYLYVKKHYALPPEREGNEDALKQKWTGLGQHIAFFLHCNTDTAILTIFANLSQVAVYALYHMVIYNIQNFTVAFSNGMEALFGDMIAKGEKESLQKVFNLYDTLISMIAVILFSTTAVLVVPFIKIYTRGLTDANYIAPLFAFLLTTASLTHCIRLPYHEITIAAGLFQQTRIAAYGEATINIITTIVLVIKFGLVGAAIGTLLAIGFRFIYYAVYVSKYVLERSLFIVAKRELVNYGGFIVIYTIGRALTAKAVIGTYFAWCLQAVQTTIIAFFITIALNIIFYRQDCKAVFERILRKTR